MQKLIVLITISFFISLPSLAQEVTPDSAETMTEAMPEATPEAAPTPTPATEPVPMSPNEPSPAFSDSPTFLDEPISNQPEQVSSQTEAEWQASDWRVGPIASTSFPTFTGLGLTLQNPYVELSLSWGIMPQYYSSFLAKTVADLSNNEALEPVIKDALSSTKAIRGGINYRFQKGPGWQIGISAVKIDSSGRTPIDDALNAALKQDFSPIVDILEQLGLDIQIAHETTLFAAEFYGGYSWLIRENFYVDLSFGLLRVLKTEFEISPGLGDLEETAPIKQIIDGAEKDLERSVTDDGYAPVLALRLAYLF